MDLLERLHLDVTIPRPFNQKHGKKLLPQNLSRNTAKIVKNNLNEELLQNVEKKCQGFARTSILERCKNVHIS